MGEIVTIQLGQYSNHVGAHWWNLQDSSFIFDPKQAEADETRINNSVLFRQGLNIKGQTTITPRLIAIDERSNIGSSTDASWGLYEDPTSSTETWNEAPIRVNQFDDHGDSSAGGSSFRRDLAAERKAGKFKHTESKVVNQYYRLADSDVRLWTDYLRVPIHPRSVLSVPDFVSSKTEISRRSEGEELLRDQSTNLPDDLEDTVRRYAEECDRLQGFHLLSDVHNAMSAVSAHVACHLRDEYRSSTILCVPVIPCNLKFAYPVDRAHCIYNVSHALNGFSEYGDLVCPLSLSENPFPDHGGSRSTAANGGNNETLRVIDRFTYRPESVYEWTSALAAGLETMSSPWRRRYDNQSLADCVQQLTYDGIKTGSLQAIFPWSRSVRSQSVCSYFISSWGSSSLTPFVSNLSRTAAFNAANDEPYACGSMYSIRGMENEKDYAFDLPVDNPLKNKFRDVQEYLEAKLMDCRVSSVYMAKDPIRTLAPYPQLFDSLVRSDGSLETDPTKHRRPDESTPVLAAPALTRLGTNAGEPGILRYLYETLNGRRGKGTAIVTYDQLHITKSALNDLTNSLYDQLRSQFAASL